jgi:polyhydroxyalkanoate synthase subunit PhaC
MSGSNPSELTWIEAEEIASSQAAVTGMWTPMWFAIDALRRMQGDALESFGFGPIECHYDVLAADTHWRLRQYSGGDAHSLLIVAAPIKQPYIWDLVPGISVVRRCRSHGLRVYLLEWTPPSRGNRNAGLAEYAGRAVGEAVAIVSRAAAGAQPFIMGHSLGGTVAAIFAACTPESIRGLVLLGAPLCFGPASSRLRDGIVSSVPSSFPDMDVVPGSLLSQLCVFASPETFVWSRLTDACLSMSDPHAALTHGKIERWALDEFPLPGKLVHEILEWLFRENRFCSGTLSIGMNTVGPSCLRAPTLVVINAADEIAPAASVRPFIDAMPEENVCLIEHTSEMGVGLGSGAALYTQLPPPRISVRRSRDSGHVIDRACADHGVLAPEASR